MMQLSAENLKFIDTYLQNSGVFYYDIRLELVDHIATAVETKMNSDNLDFYNAFKNYMVENKSSLMKLNKESVGISWQTLNPFLVFLIKPLMLVLAIAIYAFYSFVNVHSFFSEQFTINELFFVLIVSLALFQIIYFHVLLKRRYFTIEKIGSILGILYYFQLFFVPAYENKKSSALTLSIITYFFVGYVLYFYSKIIDFKKTKIILH